MATYTGEAKCPGGDKLFRQKAATATTKTLPATLWHVDGEVK